ncbi:TetR/AcrR family transcriptional regulator [Phytoactinopolyspora mesophila]|uniref:TetR family transcriptional regulator n=1 Tax=Phytoactinopolyspora mesophila TaxID=2650750 RepID=A0A7K3M5K3_9ACTN|nr:TetR/AcrR family transcriptional regulator [Phytoactinopolyspora mesophila]NDL58307.1 TetR family transcriptional regulator [Phytoactinopolyspora mesophila]
MPIRGIRERVRAELIREIKDAARRQLAEHGPDGLSVRAVTREMGMASSAVYRYFPSRDALLTALIVDAYEGIGQAAQTADAEVPRADYLGRWLAVFRAVRAWALDHPHEYALIYGSPVPGYAAPADTAAPASTVALVLARIVADVVADPAMPTSLAEPAEGVSDALGHDMEVVKEYIPQVVTGADETFTHADASAVLHVIDAWTMLFGAVSFELFGHYKNVVTARGDYLDRLALRAAAPFGMTAPRVP